MKYKCLRLTDRRILFLGGKYMRYLTLGFLVIIAFSCCQDDVEYKSNINLPQLRSEWAREYEAWKNLDIQNYQFTYKQPETHGPSWGLRITVKNEQFYEAIDIESGDQYDYFELIIDDVFLIINKSFDRDENKIDVGKHQMGTSFEVRYDPEYHFPAFLSITHIYKYQGGGNCSETIIKDFTIIDE
jgi:hypothetical protein